VRARSANEGSGAEGSSAAAPPLACFLTEDDDIAALPQFQGTL
jgi:hypothetical protein